MLILQLNEFCEVYKLCMNKVPAIEVYKLCMNKVPALCLLFHIYIALVLYLLFLYIIIKYMCQFSLNLCIKVSIDFQSNDFIWENSIEIAVIYKLYMNTYHWRNPTYAVGWKVAPGRCNLIILPGHWGSIVYSWTLVFGNSLYTELYIYMVDFKLI